MKNLAIAALTVLALFACAKDDSKGGGGDSSISGLVGVWNATSKGGSASESVDNIPSHDENYSYVEVTAAGDVTFYVTGYKDKKGYRDGEAKLPWGKLVPRGKNKAYISLSKAMIDQARAEGASEEEIARVQANGCTIELQTENELAYSCPNPEKGGEAWTSKMTRAQPTELAEKRAEMQHAQKTRAGYVSAAVAALGGKKFRFTGQTWTHFDAEGNKVTTNSKANDPDESGTGDRLYVNVNRVEFSADLRTARVNEKHDTVIFFETLKDGSGVKLKLWIKRSETSSYSSRVWGKLELTANGFATVSDTTYKSSRSVHQANFERVP